MIFKASSSSSSLIANSKGAHIANPWTLIIDTAEETITVSKRNKFLIGKDSQTIAFKFIRSITIDEHLIGADYTLRSLEEKPPYFAFRKAM
jgi:hypothetical protein